MMNDICPNCRELKTLTESASERQETNSEGKTEKIVTKAYHCSTCSCFVKSEDIIVPQP